MFWFFFKVGYKDVANIVVLLFKRSAQFQEMKLIVLKHHTLHIHIHSHNDSQASLCAINSGSF